jgi:glycosyltransferase involved in cell wall biosynthesis
VIAGLGCGGAERVAANLCNFLSETGAIVNLITLDNAPGERFFQLSPDITRIHVGIWPRGRGVVIRLARVIGWVFRIRGILARLKPDVVVSFLEMTNVMTLVATRLGSLGNTPIIVTEHSDPAHYRLGSLESFLRKLTYPKAYAVTATSPEVAAYFNWLDSRRVRVIPNPVGPARLKAFPTIPDKHGRFRIISVGRLIPSKNFDCLMLAFAQVATSFPDWDLVILGDGPERFHLQQMAVELGVAERCLLPGAVNDVEGYLAESHTFCFPSSHEGFGLALAEAMAVGLPCLTFDNVTGVRNLNIHLRTGLTVEFSANPQLNVVQLSEGLRRLITSPALRQQLGTTATSAMLAYHPDLVFSEWMSLLAEPRHHS